MDTSHMTALSAPDNAVANLIRQCEAGSQDAFRELIALYKRPVYRVAYRLTGHAEDAEDIAQEAFLRAFDHVHTLEPDRGVLPWLLTVTPHLSLNHKRGRARQARAMHRYAQDLDLERSRDGHNGKDDGVDPAVAEAVWAAWERLNAGLRAAVTLVWLEGMSHRAAAQVLGCAEGTVSWRVFEARRKLRKRLKGKTS